MKYLTPTTRPGTPVATADPAMNTRTVEVIRGGTVSNVTLTLPTIKGADFTDIKDVQEQQ